ncbi:helix-turn-helix protein [Clostridium sp. C105KSO13]|nr:helix-turn-helix transcriptional regulator [Clostridium sp. C105KSO13]CUX27894.1 helix-turn-helix protein [Clostridium sp. C105KSO13]
MYTRGLSVRQVSLMTGISKSAIQKIINNQESPTMDTMEKLASGLKVTIADLYKSRFK